MHSKYSKIIIIAQFIFIAFLLLQIFSSHNQSKLFELEAKSLAIDSIPQDISDTTNYEVLSLQTLENIIYEEGYIYGLTGIPVKMKYGIVDSLAVIGGDIILRSVEKIRKENEEILKELEKKIFENYQNSNNIIKKSYFQENQSQKEFLLAKAQNMLVKELEPKILLDYVNTHRLFSDESESPEDKLFYSDTIPDELWKSAPGIDLEEKIKIFQKTHNQPLGFSYLYKGIQQKKVHLWKNNLVPYEIDTSLKGKERAIEKAINIWQNNTDITFLNIKALNSNERVKYRSKNFILFTIGKENKSFVGMQVDRKAQKIWLKRNSSYGNVLHEIGHALGLLHEHQRPDRNKYIKIKQSSFDDDQKEQLKILNKDYFGFNPYLTPYDCNSIMHYGSRPFQTHRGLKPLKGMKGFCSEMGQRVKLTTYDKKTINDLYSKDLKLN